MRQWWNWRKQDKELEKEIQHHLRMATADRMERGASQADSEAGARREFGNLGLVKEVARDGWGLRGVAEFFKDLRFGLRMLRKNPAFTAIAVLTLSIGIGANTAVFSVVDWLMLRSLPVAHPEQLTYLAYPQGSDNRDAQFSVPEMEEIQARSGAAFSDVAGLIFGGQEGAQSSSNGLTVDGETRPVEAVFVSGGFFPMLGIRPHLGRFILPEEGKAAGADPVVVLSYRYWRKRFGRDESIVGKKAMMNGQPVTIVGVAAKGFLGLTPLIEMEAYLPLGMLTVQTEQAAEDMANPKRRPMIVFGRLQPGVSNAQAKMGLAALGEEMFRQTPRTNEKNTLEAVPLRPPGLMSGGGNPLQKVSALFLTLAGLVLAIACVNVVNLMLVRGSARQREIAVRAALGAGRGRLLRQLLAEALALGLLGCAAGVLTGFLASQTLGAIPTQSELAFALDFPFDWRVFLYALTIALTSSIVAGVFPALRLSRGNVNAALHSGGRTSTEAKSRLRQALVVLQVGVSLALLIAAGLFARSLLNARHAELGFDPNQVLNFTLDPHEIGYSKERGLLFYQELLERVRGTAGIESASLVTTLPLNDEWQGDGVDVAGAETAPGREAPPVSCASVSPGYFRSMRIPMSEGRDFENTDDQTEPRVAIVNQAMAEKFWPKQNPVGRIFTRTSDAAQPVQVIGVVKNSRTDAIYGPYTPTFYVPLAQNYGSHATLQIRARGSLKSAVPSVIGVVHSLAPTMPVTGVRTMTQALHGLNGLFLFDLGAGFAGTLGCLGLVLALVGVYGVMSYAASRRTQEIGIRMAFGARPAQIFSMIGRQGLTLIALGIGLGILAALGMALLLGDFLVGVSPMDPLTYGGISLALALAALFAALIPAARATKLEPVGALRYE